MQKYAAKLASTAAKSTTLSSAAATPSVVTPAAKSGPRAEYDALRKKMIEEQQNAVGGIPSWETEMRSWLREMDENATPDMDLVQYWSVRKFNTLIHSLSNLFNSVRRLDSPSLVASPSTSFLAKRHLFPPSVFSHPSNWPPPTIALDSNPISSRRYSSSSPLGRRRLMTGPPSTWSCAPMTRTKSMSMTRGVYWRMKRI